MKGWSTRNNNLGLMLIGGIITIQWAKNGEKNSANLKGLKINVFSSHTACRPLKTTKMFSKKKFQKMFK